MAVASDKSKESKAKSSARDSAGQVARAGQKAADEMGRSTGATASELVAAAERATSTGSDFTRSGVEAMQQMVQSGMNMAAQVAQRSSDRFAWAWGFASDSSRDTAAESRRNLAVMVECGHVLTRRIQQAQREWLHLARERTEKNLDGWGALLRCRTPQELLAAQSNLARENFEFLMNGSRRIAEISAGMAEESSPLTAEDTRSPGTNRRRVA